MDADDRKMLAAEYALGLMDEDERRDFALLLHRDADLRAELAFWQDQFSAMVPAAGVPVPRRVLDHVLADLFADDLLDASTPGDRQTDERRNRWLDQLFAPDNRPLLIGVGVAKVALVAALIWLVFAG